MESEGVLLAHFNMDLELHEGVRLSGFGRRYPEKPTLGIEEALLKVVWIKDYSGSSLIIFSADLLYFPDRLADRIADHIFEIYKIDRASLLFCGTHTHSSGEFGFSSSERSNDEDLEKIFHRFCDQLRNVSTQFKKRNLKAVEVEDEHHLTVNRRRSVRDFRSFFLRRRTTSLPNHKKKIPELIHLVGFFTEENELDLLVWDFACHPVFNVNNRISSDFPGSVSRELKKNGICNEAVFLQGFSGDIRPNFTTRKPIYSGSLKHFLRDCLKIVSYREIFKDYGESDFQQMVSNLAHQLKSASRRMKESLAIDSIQIKCRFEKIRLYSQTRKTSKELAVQLLQISENLRLFSFSAEVHSGYFGILKNKFKGITVPVGTTDHVIGYLPLEEELAEGGYEIVQSALNAGFDSSLEADSLRNLKSFVTNDFSASVPM